MLTGEELKRARLRARMSRAELAKAVGVSLRTLGSWERGEHDPSDKAYLLEEVLLSGQQPPDDPLRAASDVALLAEVARRMERGRKAGGQRGEATPTRQADVVELDDVRPTEKPRAAREGPLDAPAPPDR